MQERMKEHDRDIRLARTQNSAVSEHANGTRHEPLWNEMKFIDRNNHWYTRKVKEARDNPNDINRDNEAELLALCPSFTFQCCVLKMTSPILSFGYF